MTQAHLSIDADSLAYKAAYSEDPVEIMTYIDENMQAIWAKCWRHAKERGLELASQVAFVETWETKWNFRKFVAVSKKYKGNRSKSIPSECIKAAKKHLVDRWGANVAIICESEDRCLIRANEKGYENSYVAYIDKDLLQVPGVTFYNYSKGTFTVLTEQQALSNLWKQVATGDPGCDNIPGMYNFGQKKAENLLDKADPQDYCNLVAAAYKNHPDDYSYGYFIEQCRLIYLLREEAEVWTPLTKEEWDEL